MGTTLKVSLSAESGANRQKGLALAEDLYRSMQAVEGRLSTWKSESELSVLNRAPVGFPVSVSKELFSDLKMAYACGALTHSTFSPTVGPLVKAWGLRTRASVRPQGISRSERLKALDASRMENFSLKALTQASGSQAEVVRNQSGASIEEGGFGKGLGLDQAWSRIEKEARSFGSVVLNFGGQLTVHSKKPIPVSIADPKNRDLTIGTLNLAEGSLATSGISENGRHILDPRSGVPASFEGSVSVLSNTGFWSDCLAKALFVMGPEEGIRWMRENAAFLSELKVEAFYSYYRNNRLFVFSSCGLKSNLRMNSQQIEEGAELRFDCHS
jgi:thiamine biosynthesis lipoprotein